MKFVFEVSWEVCNKVGGIHTVIASKAREATEFYGDAYIAIGPDTGNYNEFEEVHGDAFFEKAKAELNIAGLQAKFGRWKIPHSPRVILVSNFKEKFQIGRLLFTFWEQFGVDSYEGSWDYVEPILFSTTAAEIIATIVRGCFDHQDTAVAHFHEWICGAGVLYLNKNMPKVGTVFTTHATVLGRAMAHHNSMYYHELEMSTEVEHKAYTHGVKSKHSLEAISARTADCFTTVSEFTGRESFLILNKRPDLIVYNGLDKSDASRNIPQIQKNKRKVLDLCGHFLGETLPDNSQIWISSGRYEFKNKGYDLTLSALANLNTKLPESAAPIVMLFLIAADHTKVDNYQWGAAQDENHRPIAISPVYDEEHDQIVNSVKYYGLDKKSSKVRPIMSALYLDGADGIFNMTYEDVLRTADLSLFPSFYEPWGYTPLESAVEGIPTITSDLAGFGHWVHTLDGEWSDLVKVLTRKNKSYDDSVNNLANMLLDFALSGYRNKDLARAKSEELAKEITWEKIFPNYRKAYEIARAKGYARLVSVPNEHINNPFKKAESFTIGQGEKVSLNLLSIDVPLPSKLAGLNELAYNIWSSWDKDSRDLFRSLNPVLWEYFDHSPMKVLRSIPYAELAELESDADFNQRFDKVYQSFKKYMGDINTRELVNNHEPLIAYFSMEYGLHESIPIYAGGLGILSGDHMKGASDLGLNMIGVGLFYNEGYFTQEIDHTGYQVEHYPKQDWKTLPMKVLLNQEGNPVKIPVEFPHKIVWTRVLVMQVGKVPVFLFDTDIDDNDFEDRGITAKLYAGDRRMRIKQEILVAIAGVRLLKDFLSLNPAVYHLNEGHCAFIAVERYRRMTQQGYTPQDAFNSIKFSTVFTTHTPVAAGNETFDLSLMHEMLGQIFNAMNVPFEQFLELGRDEQNPHVFSMTVLALNISSKSNAVAQLHGDVAYEMWKHVLPKDDPNHLGYVTNGVHLGSWLGDSIKEIYSQEMENISDELIWKKHQEQKLHLIDFLKAKILNDYTRKGVDLELIKQIIDSLDEDTMLIGFARRFAEYKRAGLVFNDLERLQKILSNSSKPATIIFAGKSHPNSGGGKDIIREIYKHVLDPKFLGRIILLENYNMHTGRLLTQGTDVWLNNPVIRMEACGTSGMKAAANGVLNLSIPDGWWHEGYNPEIGWSIPYSTNPDYNSMCSEEAQSIYKLLEENVLPSFYAKNAQGYSPEWVKMMRASILQVSKGFGTDRMLTDYNEKMYLPLINKSFKIAQVR